MICMITFTGASTTMEIGRRVSSLSTCFEDLSHVPLMDNYCTCLTGIFGTPLEVFQQTDKTHQVLLFLTHRSAAPSHLLSPLKVKLTTISDMCNSCKSTIISAINLLNTDPSFDGHTHTTIPTIREAYCPSWVMP